MSVTTATRLRTEIDHAIPLLRTIASAELRDHMDAIVRRLESAIEEDDAERIRIAARQVRDLAALLDDLVCLAARQGLARASLASVHLSTIASEATAILAKQPIDARPLVDRPVTKHRRAS